MTHFCHKIYDACVKYDQHLSSNVTDLSLIYDLIAYNVRDPIWTLIQSRCPSFRRRDCNAQFSEIFQESVFGSLNDSEKALFITSFQYNDCCECCGRIICGSMCSFVQYVSNYRSLPLAHFNDNWHMYLFAHNFFVTKIVCPLCGERTTVPNALTTPATVLFIEFSNEMQNQLKIQTIIEVGGLRYKLSGAVKNKNMHFTTCVTFQNSWMYIDDLTFNEELVLTTNYSTIICFLTEALDVQFDESVAQKDSTATPPKEMIVCCPIIESIVVKTFLQCKICKGKVDIRPGTGLATCTNVHCGRDFSVTHLKQQPNCCQICVVLDMRNKYVALTVTAYREVLEEYFSEEIADEVKLRSDLLNLTDVDFVITKGQKVSKMTMHKK
ncbi:uncharacterized protein LOC130623986 [Hydractinia symbiolongicarpus]|uniref:uncharacterized protein LOC130623986 n=1 Tax=Hydractinia symbiolongicarpus TaxID=13093 RepID=UPI002549D231|nr:uncharacterized protein LOC130623986 [Hydractinia symbiolongicarpus]XP_057295528.1 uncharacterized protein LOC130623986 [Hydractinia symbiolongicarpus]XP_057295529.1 uncharacterized protein LOC130623986 [Hydractinia symbiolongicarpus]